jgi:hypothetical protein
MTKYIDVDGQRLVAPIGKSTVVIGSDGRSAVVSNENGEIIQHRDLVAALEAVGWIYAGPITVRH